MKTKREWLRILYFIGIIIFLIGSIDPLEGAPLILIGSFLLALSSYKRRSRFWKRFFVSFCLIAFGVTLLLYFSNQGGFGADSELSWWLLLFILPYPVGWFITTITLIQKGFKKIKS